MPEIEVALTEEQRAALEELAKKRGVSLPQLLSEGIADLLRSAMAHDQRDRRQRALAIAGRFRSGSGDLSQRHDDYLAEASQT